MNALYQSLNPAERSFIDQKKISASYKIKRWIHFLSKASKFDIIIESETKKWNRLGVIFILLAIASVVGIFVLPMNLNFIIGIPLAVIFLALTIFSFKKKGEFKSKDINDYLRKFFMPVLNILKEKAGEDTKMAAALDFRIPRKELKPKTGKVGVRSYKSYHPNYIRSKVELLDGATLEFSVADQISDFSWSKRSASGKTKYKSKTKVVHQCLIKMTLPKSAYQVKEPIENSVAVTEHNGDYIAKHKIKLKKIGVNNALNVSIFFKGVQAIYNQFESLNNLQARKPKENDADDVEEYEDYDDGVDIMDVAAAYMWLDSDFDDYDYDSFDYAEGSDFSVDDDSATVFDS